MMQTVTSSIVLKSLKKYSQSDMMCTGCSCADYAIYSYCNTVMDDKDDSDNDDQL